MEIEYMLLFLILTISITILIGRIIIIKYNIQYSKLSGENISNKNKIYRVVNKLFIKDISK